MVYRFGALAGRLAGRDLYSIGLTGNPQTLLFDYTPFAALCSLPLTLVNAVTAQVLGLVVQRGCWSVYVVRRSLRSGSGRPTATGLWRLTAPC